MPISATLIFLAILSIPLWFFWFSIPRFFRDMPRPKRGRWVAVAFRTTVFGTRKEVYEKQVNGFLRAYLVARLIAWWADMKTPYADGEIGIEWGIRKFLND